MDFAENYSFIIQDAIQSFYWQNSQATLQPLAVYYRDLSTNELRCDSYCAAISDHLKHHHSLQFKNWIVTYLFYTSSDMTNSLNIDLTSKY